jgi:hypothetical protein
MIVNETKDVACNANCAFDEALYDAGKDKPDTSFDYREAMATYECCRTQIVQINTSVQCNATCAFDQNVNDLGVNAPLGSDAYHKYIANLKCCKTKIQSSTTTQQCSTACVFNQGTYDRGINASITSDAYKQAIATKKCCVVQECDKSCSPLSANEKLECPDGKCANNATQSNYDSRLLCCEVATDSSVKFVGGEVFTPCGTPLLFLLLPLFFAPLALYILWWPVSILISKFLLKNKGPIHGRKRRLLAKKAYAPTPCALPALTLILTSCGLQLRHPA